MEEQTPETTAVTTAAEEQTSIIKDSYDVQLGDETITITTFCFAKTMMVIKLLSRLTKLIDVNELKAEGAITDDNQFAIMGILRTLISRLPDLLERAEPIVFEFIGLVATSNKEFKRLDKNGANLTQTFIAYGKEIAYDAKTPEVLELAQRAVTLLGIDNVVKAVGPLAKMMR